MVTTQAIAVRAALKRLRGARDRHIRRMLTYTCCSFTIACLIIAMQLFRARKHIAKGSQDNLFMVPKPGLSNGAAAWFMARRTWGAVFLFLESLVVLRLVWSVRAASFGLAQLESSDEDTEADMTDTSPQSPEMRKRIEMDGPAALRSGKNAARSRGARPLSAGQAPPAALAGGGYEGAHEGPSRWSEGLLDKRALLAGQAGSHQPYQSLGGFDRFSSHPIFESVLPSPGSTLHRPLLYQGFEYQSAFATAAPPVPPGQPALTHNSGQLVPVQNATAFASARGTEQRETSTSREVSTTSDESALFVADR